LKLTIAQLRKLTEIRILSFLRINIWFIPVAVCSVLGSYHAIFFAAFLIAAIHESAHILCAKALNVPISHITVFPFGISAKLSEGYIKNSDKEFIISFVGPFSNLIMFWIFTFLYSIYQEDYLKFCTDINLAMGSINLIPALPLDGGRMLKSLIAAKYGTIRAFNFMLKLSRILIVLLLTLSVIIIIVTKLNFSLLLISAFLLQNLTHEQNSLSHHTISEILESNTKINRQSTFPTKTFTAKGSTSASRILKLLSYDYFCIIHVIDNNSRIYRSLTETEIINALSEKGLHIKLNEV